MREHSLRSSRVDTPSESAQSIRPRNPPAPPRGILHLHQPKHLHPARRDTCDDNNVSPSRPSTARCHNFHIHWARRAMMDIHLAMGWDPVYRYPRIDGTTHLRTLLRRPGGSRASCLTRGPGPRCRCTPRTAPAPRQSARWGGQGSGGSRRGTTACGREHRARAPTARPAGQGAAAWHARAAGESQRLLRLGACPRSTPRAPATARRGTAGRRQASCQVRRSREAGRPSRLRASPRPRRSRRRRRTAGRGSLACLR